MEINDENLDIFFEWMKNPDKYDSNSIDFYDLCDEYCEIISECEIHSDKLNAEKYTNMLIEMQREVYEFLSNYTLKP